MTNDELIADSVQARAARVLPEDSTASDRAGTLAMRSDASGASVIGACHEARRFLGSWPRHRSPGPAAEAQLARRPS